MSDTNSAAQKERRSFAIGVLVLIGIFLLLVFAIANPASPAARAELPADIAMRYGLAKLPVDAKFKLLPAKFLGVEVFQAKFIADKKLVDKWISDSRTLKPKMGDDPKLTKYIIPKQTGLTFGEVVVDSTKKLTPEITISVILR